MHKNAHGLYETKIGGANYEFEKWGAEESLDVLIDISVLVGKPLGVAFAALMGKQGLKKELDANLINMAMEALLGGMKKEFVKPLIIKLASFKVMCNGKPVNFDIHYEKDLMLTFKVVKAHLEVQYGNFFDALLELLQIRGLVPETKEPVPT